MTNQIINIIVGPKLEPLIKRCVQSWNKLIKYGFEIKIWNDDRDKDYNKMEFNNKAVIHNYRNKFEIRV